MSFTLFYHYLLLPRMYSHAFSSLDITKLLSTSRRILQRAQHRPSVCARIQMHHWRPFQLWEVSYFCLRQGACSLTVCHIFFHFSMSVWEALLTYYADIIFPKNTENGCRSRNWYYHLALFCRKRCVLFSAYRCLWILFQGETAYWYDGSTKTIMKKYVQLMFASGTTIYRLLHGVWVLIGWIFHVLSINFEKASAVWRLCL